jgi:retron-type reverse transcriptase
MSRIGLILTRFYHVILLKKLAKMNVTIGFCLWMRSFLEGRIQQVNLVGTLSSTKSCPAGVPQGSVISLSLFNVRVNDFENSVPDHLSINSCKYADDCTQDEFFFPSSTGVDMHSE